MKLPELKERLKNKYVVRIVAGVLVIALAGTAVGTTYTVKAAKNTESTQSTQAEASDIDVSKCIADMEQKISQVNDLYSNWNMSTAYGICYASENSEQTIRQANKIADDRMYQNKFEMKGKKGR